MDTQIPKVMGTMRDTGVDCTMVCITKSTNVKPGRGRKWNKNRMVLVSHTFVFVYMKEFGYYIFYLEHVEMKEMTVKLLKIIKHTFSTYSKAIRFC